VKTGSVSANRPSVTSISERSAGLPRPPTAAGRAILIRDSGLGPGWDQASQAESGDQDRPSTGPLSDAASSVT